ncbi:MAG: YjjG family noncanonical pyrimidine nucleotidase [Bacteroidia bacterium]
MYKHLFFDLDHTLWDFEKNSRETLLDLYQKHELKVKGISSAEDFISKYFEINYRMWDLYHKNEIDRTTLRSIRFEKTFSHFNVDDEQLIKTFPDEYLEILPTKKNLFPDATDVLDYLKTKYNLHLITNGFEHVQWAKLNSSGLQKYFSEIIISDKTGFKKPDKEIFDFALTSVNAKAEECIMIGDDIEADIKGAINAGWDIIFFNPTGKRHNEKVTYEIKKLSELKNIF